MWRRLSNSAWAIGEYLWNPILVFVCTPFFLRALGAEKYGLWMLMVATIGFGAVLNAGTGAATIKHISSEAGANNVDRVENVIQGSLAIAIVGGALLALIVVCLFWFGDDFIFAKMGDRHLLHVTGLAAAFLGWIEQIDNVFASALRGSLKYGLAAKSEIGARSLQMLLLVAALLAGAGLITVYLILSISALARVSAKMLITRQILDLSNMRPKFTHARELLHFSKWAWIQGFGGMIFYSADRFLVGSILGATSLAQYSVISQLTMQVHGLAAAGVSVVFPMISGRRARDPAFSVARATIRILGANILVSTVIAITLWVAGDMILRLWLGNQLSGHVDTLLRYLIVAYWLLALNITPYYVLLGLGEVRVVAVWALIGGFAGLAPSMYAISEFGLPGAGIGKLVYAIATLMLFIPLARIMRAKRENGLPA